LRWRKNWKKSRRLAIEMTEKPKEKPSSGSEMTEKPKEKPSLQLR